MLKSYVKIALRNFLKYKGYSAINIIGLAIGFACSFLISFYVIHELSFDDFNTKSDRIYRLLLSRDKEEQFSALTSAKYSPFIENEFPEVKKTARFFTANNTANLKYENTSRKVNGFYFADSSALQIFDYKLLAGNPTTVLNAPNTVVISEREAEAWFGKESAVGKKLIYFNGENKIDLEVTGVLENTPSNSHLQFDYLVSFTTFKTMRGEEAMTDNTNYNYYTYLLLREKTNPEQFENKFPSFFKSIISPNSDNEAIAKLQPLSDIHLNNDIAWNIDTTGNAQYLYIFSAVAMLVLFIAIVNFVNLSTARATLRAKEVGVRKTIGAERKQIIYQLFSESLLTSIIALVVSILVQEYLVKILAFLTGQNLSFNIFENFSLTVIYIAIGLFGGLLAGVYPALVLSSFQPTKVLKGEVTRGTKGVFLRKALIVSQFAISIWLIISVFIVSDQLDYMKNKKLGFNKNQVILFDVSADVKNHFDAFRNRLISNAQIKNVSLTGMPGRVGTSRGYNWPGSNGEETGLGIYTMFVDENTLQTLDIKLLDGRNFSKEISTDINGSFLINEAAAKKIGWDNPVGKIFHAWDEETGTVIGVVKDFHFKSLHQEIEPLVLDIKPEWTWSAAIKVSGNYEEAISLLEETWKEFETDIPLVYNFLDTDFDRLYKSEEKLGKLFNAFTYLGIFISCLGLLGLAAFTTQRRKKEIGIRKVMGATVKDILVLFSMEFTKLIIVSFVVASPVAYFVMMEWLKDFAYRINISYLPFLISGTAIMLLALLTTSSQILRAATTNPAKIIRHE